MPKFRIASAFVLVCTLLMGVASAEETATQLLPGAGWNTGIQIQNVGTASATIELVGYDRTTGTAQTASSQTAAAGGSVNFVGYPSAASSFDGSGVVSADQPIVGIVNVNNKPVNMAAGQYQATDGAAVADTLRFPLVKNNFGGRTSVFYVQNAGTADATITANYSGGQTQSYPGIKPGQTVLIDPATASVPSTAPFALTVSGGGQPLAGTVLETPTTTAENMQATRGFVPTDADNVVYSPIYKQNFPTSGPRNNGLQVQNTSTGLADITVVFKCSSGACGSNTYTQVAQNVPAGSSATFFKNGVIVNGVTTPVTGANIIPDNSLLAATATAVVDGTSTPVALVAINSETGAISGRNFMTTFSAQGQASAKAKLGVPLFKEEFGGNTTGVQVQNASSSASVTVKFDFNMTGGAAACMGTYTLSNVVIPAGSSSTVFRPNIGVPAGATWGGTGAVKPGCFGGVTVTVTSASGSVVGIVQETGLDPVTATTRQDNKNYEAFPIQ